MNVSGHVPCSLIACPPSFVHGFTRLIADLFKYINLKRNCYIFLGKLDILVLRPYSTNNITYFSPKYLVVGIFHLQQSRAGVYKNILTLSERVVVQRNDLIAVASDGDNPIPYDELSKESGCEIFQYARKKRIIKNQYLTTRFLHESGITFFPCFTYSIRLMLLDNG